MPNQLRFAKHLAERDQRSASLAKNENLLRAKLAALRDLAGEIETIVEMTQYVILQDAAPVESDPGGDLRSFAQRTVQHAEYFLASPPGELGPLRS